MMLMHRSNLWEDKYDNRYRRNERVPVSKNRDGDGYGGCGGVVVSRSPGGRRTQHAVMATANEWARIRELADEAGMEISRYIVHRAIMAEAVPAVVMRRAVRELLVLAKIEQERMEDLELGDRWAAIGDAVDAWLSREGDLDRLTDPGAAARWQAVSGSADPEGGPAPQP